MQNKPLLSLVKYFKPFWLSIFFVVFLLLVQAMAELYLPTLMSGIVNDGIVYSTETGVSRTDFILKTGVRMLFFALVAGASSITVAFLSPRIASGVARDLRRAVFIKVENFSQAEFDKFSSASLITRCTNDVTQVQGLANIFARMLLYAPILAFGGIFLAFQRAPSMSWIMGLMVIILLGIVGILVSIVMPKFKIAQIMTDNLTRVSRETLHGLPVIRAFGTQDYEKARFDKPNTELRKLGLFVTRLMAVVGPALTFITGFMQIIIIWYGAHQISVSGLLIGDMMAFFQYAMQTVFAFMMISMVLVMVPRAQVSAVRIAEVLNTELTVLDSETPKELRKPGQKGRLSNEASDKKTVPSVLFENVTFCYPNAEASALENISFSALPGQTTAIIGATGSGKSTIAQLLLRFYDVTDGKITVDGHDIRDVRQTDLREKIGYVPQKGQLISGTIKSNISYGNPEATDDEIKNFAAVAQASDFINEKDGGFESEISQGGGNVSGGQRQRIAIARALAKNPEIIVFDDSFSALDFQTDAKLRRALKAHTEDATIIVIAQRVGTIMNAEQILVLDEGKIIARGTHEELIKNCPEYLEIAVSQGAAS
ncbi:MAG: ABC transporter ATP-binding protein/permease [Clostridiales bacterium]|jgi:ATP-binding cassette subfamily B protein|nr:ABC transporter ATP-binding protein/permease [Clostridiales bacterium]